MIYLTPSSGLNRWSMGKCNMKKLTILAVAILCLFSATLAFAEPWGRGMGPGFGIPPFATSNLGLTPEQSQRLQALLEGYLKEITPLHNQLLSKEAEMRLLWSDANPGQEKIIAKQKEINELHRQIQEKASQHQLEFLSVLTPEQRAKMTAFGPGAGWGRGPGRKMRAGW
jgi:Spy/CpxP family protein refolding chaperone